MINKHSFDAVLQPAMLLKTANKGLSMVEDGPVELLYRASNSYSVGNASITDQEFYENIYNELKNEKTPGSTDELADPRIGLDVDDHEPTLHDLCAMMLNRTSGLINFARNVAQPMVQQTMEYFQNIPLESNVEDWKIYPVFMDKYLNSSLVSQIVDSCDNFNWATTKSKIVVPDGLAFEATGISAFDKLVRELLEATGLSVTEVLRSALSGVDYSPNEWNAFRFVQGYILQAMLLGYFKQHPWEDSGVSLSIWELDIDAATNAKLAWLKAYENQFTSMAENESVLIRIDDEDRTAYVNQAAYAKFIERGGLPEGFYGAIYSTDESERAVSFLVNDLLANQDLYCRVWEEHSRIRRVKAADDWLTVNMQNMKEAVLATIQATEDDVLAIDEESDSRVEIRNAAVRYIDEHFTQSTKDATAFAIDLICGPVLGEPSITPLMHTIHQSLSNEQAVDAAATEWAINYVCGWIANSIVLS